MEESMNNIMEKLIYDKCFKSRTQNSSFKCHQKRIPSPAKRSLRDPFSIYSTTIITGLPAKRAREYIRIRAITEICATVRDFQLWQLNYLYFISRNFIFQHASINIKHTQFSIFIALFPLSS